MADGIKIEVVGAEKVIARFQNYEARLRLGLNSAMEKIVNNIVAYIKENELSGQVLHRRTGTLSRSIKGKIIEEEKRVLGNVTSRDNGNAPVKYAAIHEYGGTIHIPARVITMYRFMSKSGNIGGLVKKKKSNFATDHQAKAYDIHIPARPYFAPAREAKLAYVNQVLNAAINQANK